VTSSQPVTTPNAINFTPDNKRAYAYSGSINVDNNEGNILEFQTNSEYLKVKFQPVYFTISTSDDATFKVKFNGLSVFLMQLSDSTYRNAIPIHLIIPPFTDVIITAYNSTDSSTIAVGATITGKAYGMTKTEYQ